MDALLNDEDIKRLPLVEQAKLQKLADSLRLAEIAELQYPDRKDQYTSYRRSAKQTLVDACSAGLLEYSAEKVRSFYIPGDTDQRYHDVLVIHRDALKDYLLKQYSKPWSLIIRDLKGLLANWWPEPDRQLVDVVNDGAGRDTVKPRKKLKPLHRELTAWLRETWIKENNLGGTAFFAKLKTYVNKEGSPILEHYSAGKAAGIRWQTSAGTTGTMKKKTILTKVSLFKNTP
jgi:hypothetical protein